MHEEILHLRGQVALLQSQLASDRDRNDDIGAHNNISNLGNDQIQLSPRDRSAYTSDDLCETAEIYEVPPSIGGVPGQIADTGSGSAHITDDMEYIRQTTAKYTKNNNKLISMRGSPVVQLYGSINSLSNKNQHRNEVAIPKMAERVRLHRTIEENRYHDEGGTDMVQSDADSSDSPHLQNEMLRLHRRIEHIRIQNTVLSLTLAESKSHCNHLYLLCGKYESNAVALHQALNCSDRAIEAYDVMLALLESRLGIVESGDDDEAEVAAQESRRAAEAVAKHLINCMESEKNLQGTSLGPWHDAIVISASSSSNQAPWTDADDHRLRGHVSKLKGQRASIQNTVVTLESPFCDSEADRGDSVQASAADVRRLDLETAVLMQELMSMREELSEYKFRAEQAEREKNSTIQRLSVMQEALLHLQAQLADSEALLAMNSKVSYLLQNYFFFFHFIVINFIYF